MACRRIEGRDGPSAVAKPMRDKPDRPSKRKTRKKPRSDTIRRCEDYSILNIPHATASPEASPYLRTSPQINLENKVSEILVGIYPLKIPSASLFWT